MSLKWRVGKYLKGNGNGLFSSTILEFAWKEWVKPRRTVFSADNETREVLNTEQKWHPIDWNVSYVNFVGEVAKFPQSSPFSLIICNTGRNSVPCTQRNATCLSVRLYIRSITDTFNTRTALGRSNTGITCSNPARSVILSCVVLCMLRPCIRPIPQIRSPTKYLRIHSFRISYESKHAKAEA